MHAEEEDAILNLMEVRASIDRLGLGIKAVLHVGEYGSGRTVVAGGQEKRLWDNLMVVDGPDEVRTYEGQSMG